MNKIKNIAEILPEGLDESTVEAIFGLVDSTINDQVEEKIGLLEAKVNAYLRTKVDQLKEQALTELSEESEVFRNARLFESVRTLMALELNSDDEEGALSEMTNQHGELQEEFDVLAEQVTLLVRENEKLQSTVKVLDSKVSITESSVDQLEGQKAQLLEEVENLEAASQEKFNSSERAVVVSQADREINEEKTHFSNEFLNDEVMKFMPFSQQS
jgi:chromosome segregation ATPase|tara:strand:- start:820 stop:1464 length:645 start_codon:yes stop_codon:yes gene_type:complete